MTQNPWKMYKLKWILILIVSHCKFCRTTRNNSIMSTGTIPQFILQPDESDDEMDEPMTLDQGKERKTVNNTDNKMPSFLTN